ncbi:MAG: RNA pyrophosphohydrolase [Pseudomonadota bacterium]
MLSLEEIARLPYRQNVGVMLVNTSGHVFVGQRCDAPAGQDAWQMPQGGIDKGEAPEDAALREIEEETGVARDLVRIDAVTADWIRYDLPTELVSKLWKGKWRGQEQKYYLMRFLGADEDINIETHEPEFSAWKWLPPAELPGAIVPFKRAVYEQVLAELGPKI